MVRRAASAGFATTSRATRCSAGDSDGSSPLMCTISPPVSLVAETFGFLATLETYFQDLRASTAPYPIRSYRPTVSDHFVRAMAVQRRWCGRNHPVGRRRRTQADTRGWPGRPHPGTICIDNNERSPLRYRPASGIGGPQVVTALRVGCPHFDPAVRLIWRKDHGPADRQPTQDFDEQHFSVAEQILGVSAPEPAHQPRLRQTAGTPRCQRCDEHGLG
jgi:hypothetical protein